MKVRLLNPNIYADPNYRKLHEKDTSPRDPGSYPIVVEGFFDECDLMMKKYGVEVKSIKVGGDELDRVFKDHYSDGKPMGTLYGSDCVLG